MPQDHDDLDEFIRERTATNPEFPVLLAAAVRRRDLIHALSQVRKAASLPRAAVAARMHTSEAAVARLEGGEVDPKMSTIERYAAALGRQIRWEIEGVETPTGNTFQIGTSGVASAKCLEPWGRTTMTTKSAKRSPGAKGLGGGTSRFLGLYFL
jgi:transcriptional regulator with XRE-family HTH domain